MFNLGVGALERYSPAIPRGNDVDFDHHTDRSDRLYVD